MTATINPVPTSATTSRTSSKTSRPSLWRTGLAAGLAAAACTVAIAVAALAMGVSLETAPGEAIPAFAFAQLTLLFTAVGVLIARAIGRRGSQPRSTFAKTTVVLTALSVVPDLIISARASTKMTLVLTHLVAAAIVIPALSSRLPECVTR